MKNRLALLSSFLVVASLVLAACGQAATATDIGTAAHPIKVLFVPSVDANVIVTGGEVMAAALNEATGLTFEVSVPTSYAATIEEMCASPEDTMGFIPALGYVLASDLCGVDVAFAAVRFGFPVYWAQFLVSRDSEFQTLEDLVGMEDLTWGYGSITSTSGYLFPLVKFQELGIEAAEAVETGGHNQSALAVYNGEVTIGTTFYSVPLNPDGEPAWTYEDWLAGTVTPDMYDVPEEVIANCAADDAEGRIICDGWTILDARGNIRVEAPDVIQSVKILALSDAVPNDTLSFGPEFPADLRTQIEEALLAFAQTDAWFDSIGNPDFYDWSGLAPITDADYDPVRGMLEITGQTIDDFR
jgi:phosphonate transport system substrate-binding protein